MQEVLVRIERSRAKNKKYAAILRNKQTGRTRRVNFGDARYAQYKDLTPLRAFSSKDHGDLARRRDYFRRHSGVAGKSAAVRREKAKGIFTPKLLSHMFLW